MTDRIQLTLDDPRVLMRALELAVERLVQTPMKGAAQILTHLRDSIEEQMKPAVEEPTETFSVIKARDLMGGEPGGPTGMFWTRIRGGWFDDVQGALRGWSNLVVTEVLRIGIGDDTDMTADEFDRAAESSTPVTVSAAQTINVHEFTAYYDEMNRVDDRYLKGVADLAARVRREIAALRSTVVTGPEKRTCDDMLALVAALLGES